MRNIVFLLLICLTINLCGCSLSKNNSEDKFENNDSSSYSEEEIESKKLEEYLDVAGKYEENSDTMSVAIEVDDDGNILECAKIKVISAIVETGTIEKFYSFDERWKTIYHCEKYFNDDGTVKADYVFAEINVEIKADKSWDELVLTDFNRYLSNGVTGLNEPKIIDKAVDYDDIHKRMTISLEADVPKTVTLGYLISKETFDNISDVYIEGRFGTFNKMDNAIGSLPIKFEIVK